MTEIINILNNFFPTDISKFILQKVDKDVHKENLYKCLEYIKLYSILIQSTKISKMFKRWNVIHNQNVINSYFPDIDETLRILNMCNCCERHKVNKPSSLQSDSDTFCLSRMKLINVKKIGCDCKCRRLSRLILKYMLNNEDDIIRHERYYLHSTIKTNILNIKNLVHYIENDISGIDCTTNMFSHTYNTYINIISSEKSRIEENIRYLDLHIRELHEISLPEDLSIGDYLIELNQVTMLNEYLKETQNDYIDYPSCSEYSEGWPSDDEMEYSEDSMS